jgi:hypothetical protein
MGLAVFFLEAEKAVFAGVFEENRVQNVVF